MNEVHQLANALLTVVFAAAMFVPLVYRKKVYESSDHPPCRSGIRAMDEPSVTTFLLTRQHTAKTGRATFLCIGSASLGFLRATGQTGHGNGRTTIRIMATAISTAAKPSRRTGNRSCFGWRRM